MYPLHVPKVNCEVEPGSGFRSHGTFSKKYAKSWNHLIGDMSSVEDTQHHACRTPQCVEGPVEWSIPAVMRWELVPLTHDDPSPGCKTQDNGSRSPWHTNHTVGHDGQGSGGSSPQEVERLVPQVAEDVALEGTVGTHGILPANLQLARYSVLAHLIQMRVSW